MADFGKKSFKTVAEKGTVPFYSEDSAKLGQSPAFLKQRVRENARQSPRVLHAAGAGVPGLLGVEQQVVVREQTGAGVQDILGTAGAKTAAGILANESGPRGASTRDRHSANLFGAKRPSAQA